MPRKSKKNSTSIANLAQLKYNEAACSDKVSEAGFNYFWTDGVWSGLLGNLAAAHRVLPNRPIYVFNVSAVVKYVAFGDAAGMAAPATASAGIPLAPGQGMILSSANHTWIRGTDANVFGFMAQDDVILG